MQYTSRKETDARSRYKRRIVDPKIKEKKPNEVCSLYYKCIHNTLRIKKRMKSGTDSSKITCRDANAIF